MSVEGMQAAACVSSMFACWAHKQQPRKRVKQTRTGMSVAGLSQPQHARLTLQGHMLQPRTNDSKARSRLGSSVPSRACRPDTQRPSYIDSRTRDRLGRGMPSTACGACMCSPATLAVCCAHKL